MFPSKAQAVSPVPLALTIAILIGNCGAVTVWAVTPEAPARERTWITATLYYVGFLALFFGLGCFGSAKYLSVQAARAQNERAGIGDGAGRHLRGSTTVQYDRSGHKVEDPKDFMAAGTVLLGGGMILLGIGHALARRGW